MASMPGRLSGGSVEHRTGRLGGGQRNVFYFWVVSPPASFEPVSVVPEGKLAVGMQLPIQSQSTVFVDAWEATAGPAELARIARACDEAGFFYVAVCDHVAIPRDKAEAMSTTWYDTMTTLGFLAAETEHVRLLSHVYVPAYRHPLVAAKALLTLDALSDGRAILGVGAGHVEAEFDALGVDFAGRGSILDEAIDIIRLACLDEFPDYDGEHFTVHDLGLRPRPVQRPRPPIWVGGSSPAAMRRAGERGDGWLPQGNPPKKYPDMIARVRDHRATVAPGSPVDLGALVEYLHIGDADGLDLGPWSVSGEPDRIAGHLRAWRDRGADHVQVRFPSRSLDELLEQIERFGADVVPLIDD
jgi:probable F420-dependent oxidoreductase